MHHGNRLAQNQANRIGVGGVFEIEAIKPMAFGAAGLENFGR
jgi:hypothetical protein